MRKLLFLLLLTLSSPCLAQQSAAVLPRLSLSRASRATPKGSLPPDWVKNFVTPAQYDTLVILNRLMDVDYTALKGNRFGKRFINNGVAHAGRVVRALIAGEKMQVGMDKIFNGICTNFYKPDMRLEVKDSLITFTTIYKSIDGYDTFVNLNAHFKKDKKTGKYSAPSYELEGHCGWHEDTSIDLKVYEVTKDGEKEITSIETDEKGKTPMLVLFGTMEFTDPLGYKHKEDVDAFFQLDLTPTIVKYGK